MPADGGGLLGPLFAGSRADPELTDRAFLQAMLDAERALAAASARAGTWVGGPGRPGIRWCRWSAT